MTVAHHAGCRNTGYGYPPTVAKRQDGFVIVAVLLLLVALGALAAGMFLETSLTTLGARSAAQAAAARPLARAGLVFALQEISSTPPAAEGTLDLGPWDPLGEGVTARLAVEEGSEPVAYRVSVQAQVGRASASAEAVLVLEPELEVLEWRE